MTEIAATATVDKQAELGEGVRIGPGCAVGPEVVLGDGCELKMNVQILGKTRLGRNNRVFAHCVVGEEPQIMGESQTPGELVIGDDNTFRENVTIHRGSPGGAGRTEIGNDNYFMVGTHIGHDCEVADGVVIGNYCQIAGHCKIEKKAWLSAFSGTHQFVTIGQYAYTGGMSGMTSDVPPFVRVAGSYPCEVRGLNVTGLRRAGFTQESIGMLEKVYRRLYRRRVPGSLAGTVAEMLQEGGWDENVRYLLASLERSMQQRLGRYLEQFRHG